MLLENTLLEDIQNLAFKDIFINPNFDLCTLEKLKATQSKLSLPNTYFIYEPSLIKEILRRG